MGTSDVEHSRMGDCDFFCLPLIFGCSNQIKPQGNPGEFHCPRCNNDRVSRVKQTKCLEICCVPLVPMGSDHLYYCDICQWQSSQSGPPPPPAGAFQQPPGAMPPMSYGYPGGGSGPPPQPGYGPQGYGPQPYAPGYQQQQPYAGGQYGH